MNRLGVLGHPVEHSRSPELHFHFAGQFGLSIDYQKLEVLPGTFSEVANRLIQDGWRGCNVTVPYKFDAHDICTARSENAQATGVVNTLSFEPSGVITGHNTDGPGLINDMVHHLDWRLREARILVLGAGGATQGILGALLEAKPSAVHVWNRTHERAVVLSQRQTDDRLEARSTSELEAQYDIIIHASAAGLSGQRVDVPPHVIGSLTCAYDLSYSQEKTPFLTWASSLGAAATADGLGMLIEQAALAFEVWFGQQPSTLALRRAEGLEARA